jgi:hypothetical protein
MGFSLSATGLQLRLPTPHVASEFTTTIQLQWKLAAASCECERYFAMPVYRCRGFEAWLSLLLPSPRYSESLIHAF